jgi:Mg-chelatase subunit ChlD
MKDPTEVRMKLRQLDVIFVIDTTGSMQPSINEVQKRLKAFAQELAGADIRPDVAFAIVAYRDHPPEDPSYVTQVYPLTDSVVKAQHNVDGLKADGGGDGPEAVLDALNDALNAVVAREHAHRVIILVGDAPPHGMGVPSDRWGKACPCGLSADKITGQARASYVAIHAVGVREDGNMIKCFQRLAEDAGGLFVRLSQIDTLIPRILELLRVELGKMAADSDVYDIWATSDDRSPAALAAAVGRPVAEIEESLNRLRAKGVLDLDGMSRDALVGVLRSITSGELSMAPPMDMTVDPDLLALIVLPGDLPPDDDIQIRFLDE